MTGPALVFSVGARRFAVDAADVTAVARRPPLTRLPHAPPAIAGMGALLGRATPVVELSRWLGEGPSEGAQVLLLRGEDPTAIAVDAVEGVREAERASAERLDVRAMLAQLAPPRAARQPTVPAVRERAPTAGRVETYLQFALAGQRFAFPVAEVLGVVQAPADLAAAPDADPVVCGLTTFADKLLPVVELAHLLGLPAASIKRRLVVVEIGGAPVGLRVEQVLGVLRAPSGAVHPAPAVLNRGQGEARVTAIAQSSSGLTAILAAERLFDEDTTRRLVERGAAPRPQVATKADDGEAIVVFRLGPERYGLPAAAVEAVAKAPALVTRPPNAPRFLAGATSFRGVAVPLLDQRRRLDAAADAAPGAAIYVRDGETIVGLLVDGVERLARLPRSQGARAPALAGEAFGQVLLTEAGDKPLLIVDAGPLLAHARRDLVASAPPRRDAR